MAGACTLPPVRAFIPAISLLEDAGPTEILAGWHWCHAVDNELEMVLSVIGLCWFPFLVSIFNWEGQAPTGFILM
jgi:hypothetical protein